MSKFTTDHVDSDDLDEILQMSLADHTSSSSPSHTNTNHNTQSRINTLSDELSSLDADIERLQVLRASLRRERQELVAELTSSASRGLHGIESDGNAKGNGKRKAILNTNASVQTDYQSPTFDWSTELKTRLKSVFGINEFRLCQEGVCNANMDGRDVVCVMPTGGGKSLTYQLPALLNPGCTIVISPLISLITDQIVHLRERGVEAVMLTGSTTKEETRDIFTRLTASVGTSAGVGKREIKLCYVTPEKIAKSKTFVAMLEKLARVGRLARIVIDEAHCVSQLGHDFRPDYKKLSILRQLFPRVPILALSATCPPRVLEDFLTTLRLGPIFERFEVGGGAGEAPNNSNIATSSNNTNTTVYFSAPLYRKNLHYKVLPKPASASKVVEVMKEYILEEKKGLSGIVYCLSKKDAENVALGLQQSSNGAIRTGVYHADVPDKEKEGLHMKWRRGDVNVVCATIAFGLGIDKGDVRFVLHHSMSKSLDGYYQESGRAGRDGNDADCILYYRPQDATRLSSLICGELEGQDKLHDMLRFAQDLEQCRKVQFAKYFSSTSSLSLTSWTTTTTTALSKCGHCDNCLRRAESIVRKDVTLETWKILRVIQTIERDGGRVTMSMLGDLVRGAGGGAFGVSAGGGGKGKRKGGAGSGKEKVGLDLEGICGGKVGLGKDETETLLVQLTLSKHLKESFHSTAYAINVYVLPGPNALRVARFSREDVEGGKGQRVECCFPVGVGGGRGKGKGSEKVNARKRRGGVGGDSKAAGKTADKNSTGKNGWALRNGDRGDIYEEEEDVLLSDEEYGEDIVIPDFPDETDEDEGDEDWAFTMRTSNAKRSKSDGGCGGGSSSSRALQNGDGRSVKRRRVEDVNANSDVIVLSD